jgi:hypothetical protein
MLPDRSRRLRATAGSRLRLTRARRPWSAHLQSARTGFGYRPPFAANEAISAIRSRTGRVETDARAPEPACVGLTHPSPAGSRLGHVMGLQRSVREWAIRQGWDGRPVRQEQGRGILIEALGMLASPSGLRRPPEQAASPCKSRPSCWPRRAVWSCKSQARRPPEDAANEPSLGEVGACLRGEEAGSDCDTNQISS